LKIKTRLSKKNQFLVVLSETLRSHEKMIGREISYRMGKFKEKEIADLQGRIGECKTYIQDIVESQLTPVTTKEGRRKLKRFKEDPEYITKYIYGSIPNYCKRKRREWDTLFKRAFKNASDDRTDDEFLSSSTNKDNPNQGWDSEYGHDDNYNEQWDSSDSFDGNNDNEWDSEDTYDDNYQEQWDSSDDINGHNEETGDSASSFEGNNDEKFGSENSSSVFMYDEVEETEIEYEKLIEKRKVQRKLLQNLLKKKGISPIKRRCLKDRFAGMSFPQMAMKYESKEQGWDRKGNKYRKRFYRTAAEIGLDKKNIDLFLKEIKKTEKIIQKLQK
jgi:hypothetical protein